MFKDGTEKENSYCEEFKSGHMNDKQWNAMRHALCAMRFSG